MESHSTLEANSTNPTPTYQPRHSVTLTISIQNGSHKKPWYSAQPWEPLSWRLRNYDSRSHNYRQVSLTDTSQSLKLPLTLPSYHIPAISILLQLIINGIVPLLSHLTGYPSLKRKYEALVLRRRRYTPFLHQPHIFRSPCPGYLLSS